jgi:uncharacterized protein YbjT (DUF2867 family)
MMTKRHAVTGAFGYTGKYITQKLLKAGHEVITLTGHPNRPHSLEQEIPAFPFDFEQPDNLARSLNGVDTLFNTYWIRFSHKNLTFEQAVENTKILFAAAKKAGVRRVVHVSITNPDSESRLPYFRGKAHLETDLKNSGLSYAIIRPTVIFGAEDILINNIAHLLRRFPFFAIPGQGDYRLQPIFVKDLAHIAVEAGEKTENLIIDAVGPKIYTFRELLEEIKRTIGSKSRLVSISPGLALTLSRLYGLMVQDVVLTGDEVSGLMGNLLISDKPATGKTSLENWLLENASTIGKQYASELKRHY